MKVLLSSVSLNRVIFPADPVLQPLPRSDDCLLVIHPKCVLDFLLFDLPRGALVIRRNEGKKISLDLINRDITLPRYDGQGAHGHIAVSFLRLLPAALKGIVVKAGITPPTCAL